MTAASSARDARARERAPRLLVIAGPTGTGKSETATRVALRIDGEILGCDAVQVYRGLDAASAKPSAEARALVPHHLIDFVDARRSYTVADYVRDAEIAIAEIAARGRVPIIVGGTGLYLRGLLRGIVSAPPVDPEVRRRLRAMASRHGSARLHRWLVGVDPDSARRIHPGDAQRVTRALEIALGGGTTWSERLRREGTWHAGIERFAALKVGLDAEPERLDARLAERVAAFFDAGLVPEVHRLLAAGVPRHANAFKAIGYREVLSAIERNGDPATVGDDVVQATRRYRRRQRTWFRREVGMVWLDAASAPDALAARIVELWRQA